MRLPYTRAGDWLSLNRSSICRSARYVIGFIPTLIRSASGAIFGLNWPGLSLIARYGSQRDFAAILFLLKWSNRTSVAAFPPALNSEMRSPAANASIDFGAIRPPTYSISTPSEIPSGLSRIVLVTSPASENTEWSCSANLTASKSGTTEMYISRPANGFRSLANCHCSNVRGESESSSSAFCFRRLSVSFANSAALSCALAISACALPSSAFALLDSSSRPAIFSFAKSESAMALLVSASFEAIRSSENFSLMDAVFIAPQVPTATATAPARSTKLNMSNQRFAPSSVRFNIRSLADLCFAGFCGVWLFVMIETRRKPKAGW